MTEPSSGMSLSALLAKLEAEVSAKLQTIAVLRAEMGLPGWTGGGSASSASTVPAEPLRDVSAPGVIRPDEFFRMTIPDAIRRFLSIMRKPQSPKAIADGLQAGGVLSNAKKFYSNITTSIGRMEAAGALVNTPNGWGLSDWYPSRPKSPEPPKKAKKRPSRPRPASTKERLSEYQRFVKEGRAAGKDLKQLSKEWAALKNSATASKRGPDLPKGEG